MCDTRTTLPLRAGAAIGPSESTPMAMPRRMAIIVTLVILLLVIWHPQAVVTPLWATFAVRRVVKYWLPERRR
jgi:hypothetical protein